MPINAKPLILWNADLTHQEDDCACASVAVSPPVEMPLSTAWRKSDNLYSLSLSSEHKIFLSPRQNGLAILNHSACDVLNAFSQHLSIKDAFSGLKVFAPQAFITARQLASLGLLKPVEQDCACVTEEDCGVVRPSGSPLTSWLHLTDRCNLRCDYCYLPHVREDMSPETGSTAIYATFRSALTHGFREVKLKYAGGEPLLCFPLIVELHRYAQELAEQCSLELDGVVLSNGTLLTESLVSSLQSLDLRLMISLDGLGEFHNRHRRYASGRGSSADVVESIELALAHGLTPNISITISPRTVDGLPEVVDWVLERDLPFSLNFYRENDFSASHADMRLDEEQIINGMLAAYKVIEDNLPRHSLLPSLVDRANLAAPHLRTCGVGENYLVFDARGRVAKCQMRMADSIADVSTPDPLAVLRADRAGIQNLPVEEKESCRDCQWRYWCAGGCPLETYRVTGRYDVKSPHCNIYQSLFPEVLLLEGLRLLKYQDDPQVVQKITL